MVLGMTNAQPVRSRKTERLGEVLRRVCLAALSAQKHQETAAPESAATKEVAPASGGADRRGRADDLTYREGHDRSTFDESSSRASGLPAGQRRDGIPVPQAMLAASHWTAQRCRNSFTAVR